VTESAHHEHHRNVRDGRARAAVFGASDGLVSNLALVLGMAGSGVSSGVVLTAGIAGLVAGAVSMAAGEWVSMQAQRELMERELDIERRELHRNPRAETRELAAIYESRGVSRASADAMAEQVMADPDTALQAHAREELGIDPEELGAPIGAAVSSFLAFAAGAIVPLVAWVIGSGVAATAVSIAMSLVAAAMIGAVIGRFSQRPPMRTAARQVAVAAVACAVTYGIGAVVGASGIV
jgi:vacuolar iron transporter family protein